jgi:hypothetical protein
MHGNLPCLTLEKSKEMNNLKLTVASDSQLRDLQQDFNERFPFLKIEFYRKDRNAKGDRSGSSPLPSHLKIKDISYDFKPGTIEVNEDMPVGELEEKFRDLFKLSVQVYRKSGGLWLETTKTDRWTLKEQNNHGMEISNMDHSQRPGEELDLDAFS